MRLSDLLWYILLGSLIVLGIVVIKKGLVFDKEQYHCVKTCGPSLHKFIDDICHCKSINGWDRAK